MHATGAFGSADLRSLYGDRAHCPLTWSRPTVVAVPAPLRELLDHPARPELGADARLHAQTVVFDLPRPLSVKTLPITEPEDPRARLVAAASPPIPR
ncbi:hypothetical protein [Streptomyces physcomitrii]|uniref:Uncharacterized protein n=1 Tax=Streptomyces physcomitrii TaxID=2724184 RepID=A0ABX1HAN8_9ACTN|nr:hypothetical protein [Streptomyces physcomitrii]NKI44299.1 hypothetical protein [Streptomyces physcomitrii]